MLCRLWLVSCLAAARENLPKRIEQKQSLGRSLPSFISCLLIVIPLLSLDTHAQSAPSISSISPTVGPVSLVGGSGTINGRSFGGTQRGSSTVTFRGLVSAPTSWNDTKILAPVPSSLTAGFVDAVVTVSSTPSNAKSFLVIPGVEVV